jgi:tetratricopeptide (TPR) repeat protein
MTGDHSTLHHEESSAGQRRQPLVVGHWSLVILLSLALLAFWVIWPKVVSNVWANLGTVELSRAMVGEDTSGLEPARVYLERATQWDAGHGQAYRNLGRLAALRGDLSTAMWAWTRATETLPNDVWAHVELGDACWDLGRKDEAVNWWVRAASVDPEFVRRLEQESPAGSGRFTTRSEYERVLGIVAEAAVKAHPGQAYPYMLLGFLARDRGDYPEATRWFSLAAQVDRGSHDPLRELGIVAERQGRYDLATAYFRKAIEREPRQPSNYASLAGTYARQREFDLAAEWYQRALALYPDSAGDHYGLAQAYYQLGRYADALAEYRQVLSLEPGHQASQAQVAALEQILSEEGAK